MIGKDLLYKMEQHNFFAHCIEPDEKLTGVPIAVQSISTHYLMQGGVIVFVGSAQGIINFVENYKKED